MFSFSKVECYGLCPYKFKLKYIDKLTPVENIDPVSPLIQGTVIHEGIEKRSIEEALALYKSKFPLLTKVHEVEMQKITYALKKAIVQIPEGDYEYKLLDPEGFIGFIDCLVPVADGVYDLLDFKFSNNVNKYKRSGQVHIYRYYFEMLTGKKIRHMYYVCIPKMSDDLSNGYTDQEIHDKIFQFYEDNLIIFEKINYDLQQVDYFFRKKFEMFAAKEFPKNPNPKCRWCDFFNYCSTNGEDMSGLVVKEADAETETQSEPTVEPVSLF